MITFIALAIALVALAMAFVLLPLLRNRAGGDIDRASANLGILKDQLAELENDHRRGSVSDAHYAEAKAELERRVLEEVQAGQPAAGLRHKGAVQAAAVTLALVLPIGSALIYARLGDPQAFGSARVQAADDGHAMAPEQIEKMLGSLKERLAREPDNANGWATLARTYYSMGRFGEAADAYGKLVKLVPDNADILADYADSLAMARGRQLAGEPMALIAKALKLDPTQWKALAMAGTEAFERRDFQAAVDYWERLQTTLPPDAPIAQQIARSIADARVAGKMPPAPVAQNSAPGTSSLPPDHPPLVSRAPGAAASEAGKGGAPAPAAAAGVHLRAAGRWLAHAAGPDLGPGQGPAGPLHARRDHGHVAQPDAGQRDHRGRDRRTGVQERLADAQPGRPGGPVQAGQGRRPGRQRPHRPRAAVAAQVDLRLCRRMRLSIHAAPHAAAAAALRGSAAPPGARRE